MDCTKCKRPDATVPDRKDLKVLSGALSDASLAKAVPPGKPFCLDCAVSAIRERIIHEVHWCEARGKHWGGSKTR